ncbi:hypothetical protein M3226_10835 [Neobacillus cucumis]|uniref:hypothetical protein n=1 Tax=Neobacillus cucumis TaxID=1740721 RepID=UPI00203A9254|nr:hypothetical protein [Neobacillus cucumis]MCM3726178.1 hypothetical protein [Neobacillus cucumis]
MESSLGGAFGFAISAAVYGAVPSAAIIEVASAGGVIVSWIKKEQKSLKPFSLKGLKLLK